VRRADTDPFVWTGHPLVDVGVATLCAMAARDNPAALTDADLAGAAGEMSAAYLSGALTSYLTCVFMNAAYVQSQMTPAARLDYASRMLGGARTGPPAPPAIGLSCVFCGAPAKELLHRGQMPMLTGADVLNFFPAARGGLSACGSCLMALQALPLGGRRTEGRLLVVHSDDPALTLLFARRYLADNRRLLALARTGSLGDEVALTRELAAFDNKKHPKFPDAKDGRTLVLHDLLAAYGETRAPDLRDRPVSLTAYWLSSSGQGAALDILRVPSQIVRFGLLASSDPTRAAWQRVLSAGWPKPEEQQAPSVGAAGKGKRTARRPTRVIVSPGAGRSRNVVLSDLFRIYEAGDVDLAAASRFVKRHLLKDALVAVRHAAGSVPAPTVEPGASPDWPLATLFIREVLGMDQKRIDALKQFADRLADYIVKTNDRGLFGELMYRDMSWQIRNALVKAQRNHARQANDLLFGLEQYLEVFEADDAVGQVDWRLTRDLICIRLVERLQREKFFDKPENKDVLEPTTANAEAV
jgi:CRISPR-associated protein Cst1